MQKSKTVTVTHQAIYEAHDALKKMGERDLKLELAHRVMLTIKNVRDDMEVMNEVQEKVVDKYVERDEDGNKVSGSDSAGFVLADPEAYQKEWKEFLKLTKKIEVYPLLSTDFGEKAKLQANILLGMMGIEAYKIVEDGKEKKKKSSDDTEE